MRIARVHILSLFSLLKRSNAFVQVMAHSINTKAPTNLSATERPYGSWESPITSKSITAGSVAIGNLNVVDGQVFWTEGRPKEGGRTVLCKYAPGAEEKSDRNAVDVTPQGSNIRTLVHEYGGGALCFGKTSNELIWSEFEGQNLCTLGDDGKVQSITMGDKRFRYADGKFSNDAQTFYSVREDHEKPAPKDVVNEIVSVNVQNGDMKIIASGRDFYAAPRLSPDQTKLAYITWNHPNMPWDATELRLVTLDGKSSVDTDEHELIAGQDGDTSILQPLWHPINGHLYYISDESGFYNIYRAGLKESILPLDTDFGGAAPGWQFGSQGFNFLDDGRLVATYQKDGKSVVVVASLNDDGSIAEKDEFDMDSGLPMKVGGVIGGGSNAPNDLYFIGGSPSTPTSVYKWDMASKKEAEVLACSSSLSFPDEVISIPQQIEFPTTLGTAFGYYYPPKNDEYICSTSTPPLLVKAHGGPTACTSTAFNAGIQFWTSRGFAVLDVDYSGSTGYGRDYRRRLRKSWGIVDIDDVCNGAKYLVEEGKVDNERLCIDGGSAGGYTTLGALAFRSTFKAGTSLYGIGDLSVLAGDTHKFESRYLDGLVGRYPEDEEIYKQRSPIESVDTLACPILLLQGAEDKVVPPNQAKMMHDALLKKKIPTCLKIYEKEQHGFRKAENIEDALDSELAFYGRVFNIDVPNAIEIDIDNM